MNGKLNFKSMKKSWKIIQSSFLRFHRVDTLIIGLRYEVERNKNEWEKMGKQ